MLPALAVGVMAFIFFTSPRIPTEDLNAPIKLEEKTDTIGEKKTDKHQNSFVSHKQSLSIEREHETGVDAHFTGWLTVSRKYFIYPTGGPNNSGNPPQPESNSASLNQSESAYSSLYKFISNSGNSGGNGSSKGNGSQSSSSITPGNGAAGQQQDPVTIQKKSKLIKYFAVLRHGNLFLYEDQEQKNMKHVIVIAHHFVTIWPPNVPDGQLFAKRSAICLVKVDLGLKKDESVDEQLESVLTDPDTPPNNAFYLYSDYCSEKEDFYFALVRASKRYNIHSHLPPNVSPETQYSKFNPVHMAHPLHYKTVNMMDLIQTLHSSDANIQTRWLNALLGRLFLSMNKTSLFEDYFRNRIITKLTRTKRPSFLSEIEVTKISAGDSIPYFTNLKLSELTPEGKLTVESDVSYSGNFSLEITTKVVINLGSRFKPREVTIALSVALRHLEGRLVIKMKPPPSDRIWYAFETMPKISLHVEPIVSSRQIKYSVVTNTIESRIREAIKETLVLPFLDDLSFYDTRGEVYRGGIWDPSVRLEKPEETASVDLKPDGLNKSPETLEPIDDPYSATSGLENDKSKLRQRKTTADLRSSSFISEAPSTISEPAYSPELNFSESVDGSPSLNNEVPFDLTEHIGELKRSGHTFPEQKSNKNTIVGAMKKIGTWYMKDRKNSSTENQDSVDSIRKKIAHTLSKDSLKQFNNSGENAYSSSSPLQAPSPHKFPPEIMNSIKKSNIETKPHYEQELLDKVNEPQISSKKEELSTPDTNQSTVSETQDVAHAENPSLTLLKKSEPSAKVTIPTSDDELGSSIALPTTIQTHTIGSAKSSLSSSLSSSGDTKPTSFLDVLPESSSTTNNDENIIQTDLKRTRSSVPHVKRKAVGSGPDLPSLATGREEQLTKAPPDTPFKMSPFSSATELPEPSVTESDKLDLGFKFNPYYQSPQSTTKEDKEVLSLKESEKSLEQFLEQASAQLEASPIGTGMSPKKHRSPRKTSVHNDTESQETGVTDNEVLLSYRRGKQLKPQGGKIF